MRQDALASDTEAISVRRLIGIFLAAVSLCLSAAHAEPIGVKSHPVPLSKEEPGLVSVGELRYRGGIELTSNHPDFGGLSGLRVSADGLSLYAITDRGKFLTARLIYDEMGLLQALTDADLSPLPGVDGTRRESDAEALSEDGSGGWIVAFEQRHRLSRFSIGHPRVSEIALPPAVSRLPSNSGIEAFARLQDGRWLILSEHAVANGTHPGWLHRDGSGWLELTYLCEPPFAPTDAASLPSGDVLVVERAFHPIGGWGARIVHVDRQQLGAGMAIWGQPLATIQGPLNVDNFEGLAARPVPGNTRLCLLSDNNFNFLQRTLLLTFNWPDNRR